MDLPDEPSRRVAIALEIVDGIDAGEYPGSETDLERASGALELLVAEYAAAEERD